MWLAGSESVHVYLGVAKVGVQRAGAEPSWIDLAASDDATRVAIEHAKAATKTRVKLSVWLSGALARPFLAGPMTGLRRWSEVERVFESAAPDATGLDQPCSVWVSGDPGREQCAAVAVPRQLIEALQVQAKSGGTVLRSVRPWWSSVFNATLGRPQLPAMWIVDDGESLTSLRGTGDAFSAASTCCPRPPQEQLPGWLARQAVGQGVLAGEALYCAIPSVVPWQREVLRLDVPFGAAAGALP